MKYLFIFLTTICGNIYSQDVKFPLNSSGQIEYTEVVQCDSFSAKKLFSNAKLFIANAFVSKNDVTQLEDAETNTLVVKGLIPSYIKFFGSVTQYGFVKIKITIQAKENRYKYIISELYHEYKSGNKDASGGNLINEKPDCGNMTLPKKHWLYIKENADEAVKKLIISIKKGMLENIDSNW